MENPTDPGTPDVSFSLPVDWGPSIEPIEGWMELKWRKSVPLMDEHGIRPSQKIWIRRRLRAGGRVILAIGIGPMIYFLPGRLYDTVNDMISFPGFPSAPLDSDPAVQKAFILAVKNA